MPPRPGLPMDWKVSKTMTKQLGSETTKLVENDIICGVTATESRSRSFACPETVAPSFATGNLDFGPRSGDHTTLP